MAQTFAGIRGTKGGIGISKIGYINVALELFGGLLSLIIMLCLVLIGYRKSRLERLYLRILACNTAVLFCDAVAWITKGQSGPVFRMSTHLANFCVFTLGYILLALFTDYLVCLTVARAPTVTQITSKIMWGLAILAIGLVVVSQFNHMYYLINEQNIYHRQEYFWVSQLFGVLCMLLNGLLLLKNRKHFAPKEFVALLAYIIMPVVALLIQMAVYGVAILYLATTISILCMYMSIQVEQSHLLQQRELELERSRTAIILSQIQPHFLGNALQSIKRLCDTDPAKASLALEQFSCYLRGNLDSLTRESLVPFTMEIEHVRNYLYLEKMRFEERIQIIWELWYQDFMIPPLILQTLVENAVRHGITKRVEGGTLIIRSSCTDFTVTVTVLDNGVGFDPSAPHEDGRSHTGVENARERLRALCGGTLTLQSRPGIGTEAIMTFPLL